ncbi:MAG: AtpZ/AtpI family protein [Acidobacteriota bacterium]|nr:AtpZ/AtpI family protein [Acidobacteriota bacterium]
MARSGNGEANRKSGIAYAAAFALFMCVASMTGVGWVLDRWLQTTPWFLVGGIVLGAIAGFYQFVRLTSRL